MPGYLLLRNNKETGPHTLEEMIAKDLKQHDLIWVEGRSAAWRYPEELDEFRKYIAIPVVAENVKPAAANEMFQHPAVKKPIIPEQPAFVQASGLTKNEPVASREKEAKYISVIFPNTSKPVVEKKHTDTPAVVAEKLPPVIKEKIIVEEEVVPSFSASSFTNKFPERKLDATPKQVNNITIPKNLLWGLAILLGGIVLGLSLDNIFSAKVTPPPEVDPVAQQTILPVTQEQETTVYNPKTDENSAAFVNEPTEAEKPAEKMVRKKPVEKNIVAAETNAEPAKNNPLKQENTASTSFAKNEALNEEKERAKANIRHLLSVTNSKFKIGAFGGINELQISVTNNSHYPVDAVAIDVQYVLASKKVFKTETLYFKDLRPGVTLMQQAPKSQRGVKVEYSINAVSSKVLGL